MERLSRKEDGVGKNEEEGREVGGCGQQWLPLIFISRGSEGGPWEGEKPLTGCSQVAMLPVRSPLELGTCVYQGLSGFQSLWDTQGPRDIRNPVSREWPRWGQDPAWGAR